MENVIFQTKSEIVHLNSLPEKADVKTLAEAIDFHLESN